jgi:ring-1,2-phenylacetyl-CoA epoxidase subunit PaaC
MKTTHKIETVLHLADSALILAQRNGEWCAHGPILEQDIAITNITLDLIGQARNFYQYAVTLIAKTEGKTETEDSLAYLRNERAYKNLLLCELPNGDWGQTILRQFFFSAFQQLLFEKIINQNSDSHLTAIAAKAIKETQYHVKWSAEWVIRLGDGTEESKSRMYKALDALWMYTGELFTPAPFEIYDIASLKEPWLKNIKVVLEEATLSVPTDCFMQTGGKTGVHTEHLGYILSEMQYLQRAYPGAEW